MRREWTGWIKERRWEEFERLAKKDPTQALADTIGELERGFPDKQDKRALRKVLFLLRQAGYQPQETQWAEPEPELAPTLIQLAFMVPPDKDGFSRWVYVTQIKNSVRMLDAITCNLAGFIRAEHMEFSIDQAPEFVERLKRMVDNHFTFVEVPIEFARRRLAEAAQKTGERGPSALAYWRAHLGKPEPGPHPAEAFEAGKLSTDEVFQQLVEMGMTYDWRLEFGTVTNLLQEFLNLNERADLLDEQRDLEMKRLKSAASEQIFTPKLLDSYRTQLLDLAYALSLRQSDERDLVIAAIYDLAALGHESAIARALLDRTLFEFANTLLVDKQAGGGPRLSRI